MSEGEGHNCSEMQEGSHKMEVCSLVEMQSSFHLEVAGQVGHSLGLESVVGTVLDSLAAEGICRVAVQVQDFSEACFADFQVL